MPIDDPTVLASLAESLADVEGVTETIDQIVSFAVDAIDTTYGGITLDQVRRPELHDRRSDPSVRGRG